MKRNFNRRKKNQIPAAPSSGGTSQPQIVSHYYTQPTLSSYSTNTIHSLRISSACTLCSQPLGIQQGIKIKFACNGQRTVPVDPTTGTHLPEKKEQKSQSEITCFSCQVIVLFIIIYKMTKLKIVLQLFYMAIFINNLVFKNCLEISPINTHHIMITTL